MKKLPAIALAAAMLLGSSQADAAITVDFSFAGNASEPGAVTGHLTFDGTGTNVAATGVYIDSATGAVNPPVSGYQGYNFLTGAAVYQNLFTITAAGTITSAALNLTSPYAYANVSRDFIELNGSGTYNLFEQDYSSYYDGSYFRAIENTAGFSGATYAASTSAVPEPAAWAMMILGMGAIGCSLRRRKVTMRLTYAS